MKKLAGQRPFVRRASYANDVRHAHVLRDGHAYRGWQMSVASQPDPKRPPEMQDKRMVVIRRRGCTRLGSMRLRLTPPTSCASTPQITCSLHRNRRPPKKGETPPLI